MTNSAQNVVLWGIPRSVSTAFEKTFANRSDTYAIHEPFAECYYFGRDRKSSRYGEEANKNSYTKEDAYNRIFINTHPITFTKDLTFQAHHYISDEFLEKVTSSFIMRHPYKVFSSLKKLKPDFTREEFGFQSFEKMWNQVKDVQGKEAVLVEGEIFQQSPKQVLEEYCEKVGVEFQASMLTWEDGKLQEWGKGDEEVHTKWHKTLENSRSILTSTSTDLDLEMNDEQKYIIDEAIEIYDRLLPFAIGNKTSLKNA
ncbi:sulfotransferase family protein [Priestia filamentosa]|uniref:sulfotransferase-like domain-containing protein n=1 Tax=Priestia filamentosa TaxID=1402861 RepID=UPI001FB49978|nr:hypothetical protein [Priestia filamentosa]UOE58702.1 sulfotransferase family protein [Priestia filamentosa]